MSDGVYYTMATAVQLTALIDDWFILNVLCSHCKTELKASISIAIFSQNRRYLLEGIQGILPKLDARREITYQKADRQAS